MKPEQITPQIHYIGVNDRTTHLFESLWPLPQGVSYNAYIVAGQKVALVDTVEAHYAARLIDNIHGAIGDRKVDYLIINHMEPDHSSSIRNIRAAYPDITIVGNAKTLQMLEGYYGITDNTMTIAEGDKLDLGEGVELTFYLTPMVHWPETMMTWCAKYGALFSGDAFGCFGTLNGAVVDQDMDTMHYTEEMIRYYSNIVGKYGAPVQKAIAKLAGMKIELICPTHGPVWREQVDNVVSLYDRLSRYHADQGVVIAYGSMYGNTEAAAEAIARQFAAQGVKNIAMHNLSVSHYSFVLADLFKYSTIIIGSPTYNGGIFPPVENLMQAIESRGVKNRSYGVFGSFTWAGTAAARIDDRCKAMGWTKIMENLEFKQGYK